MIRFSFLSIFTDVHVDERNFMKLKPPSSLRLLRYALAIDELGRCRMAAVTCTADDRRGRRKVTGTTSSTGVIAPRRSPGDARSESSFAPCALWRARRRSNRLRCKPAARRTHRDGRRFDGQPSLSGHCGHEAIFGARRSVANDPKATFSEAAQRAIANGSLRFDVRLANDPAEVVILLPEKSGKICAAYSGRMKSNGGELRPQLGCLQCRGEPTHQLRDFFLGRLCRSQVQLTLRVAKFGDGRYLWQRLDPRP